MQPRDRRILNEFAARIRAIEPGARLWAFGSRARGDAAPDSDLDLCVVVPQLTPELRRDVQSAAWQIGFEHGCVLATLILPQEEFENGPVSATALVRNIRAEGVAA
jgi:UTP:GlnB (protein PII) uridylyltransferase